MTQLGQWLTVQEAAQELHLSPRAVLHRIKAGTIAAEKLGQGRTSAYAIHRDEIARARGAA